MQEFTTLYDSNQDRFVDKACSSVSYARENSIVALEAIGLPNNKLEYWKYSRIGKVLKGLNLNTDTSESIQIESKAGASYEILSLHDAIVNQHPLIEKHLTQYAGIKNEGLTALNTACFTDGLLIHVPDNTNVEEAIRNLSQ